MPTKSTKHSRRKGVSNFRNDEKNFQGVSNRKLKTILISIGVIVILIIIGLIWLGISKVTANTSYYSVDKSGVESKLKGILDSVQPNDKLLYEDLSDIGCDNSNSVGLALYVHCEVVAQKYYENTGDIILGLKQILAAYARNGWTYSGYANQGKSTPNAELMTQTEGNYLISSNPINQKVYSQVYVEFIGEDGKFETYRIKELIDDGKMAQPTIGSKVYGLFVSETYWSCKEDSFFETRCPTPSSKP